MCDPHAAAIVFAAPLELTSVGFDLAGQCRVAYSVDVVKFFEHYFAVVGSETVHEGAI